MVVVVVVVMVVREVSKQMLFTAQNLVDCSKRQC